MEEIINGIIEISNNEIVNGIPQSQNLTSLLVTGQTISYADGDDGDLEKGIEKNYTVLTTDNMPAHPTLSSTARPMR